MVAGSRRAEYMNGVDEGMDERTLLGFSGHGEYGWQKED